VNSGGEKAAGASQSSRYLLVKPISLFGLLTLMMVRNAHSMYPSYSISFSPEQPSDDFDSRQAQSLLSHARFTD
jgi:hypothetical protein